MLPEVEPMPDDPSVRSRADKFFATDLEDILRGWDIRTAVIGGTLANGAVLYTAYGANLRGYTVVVAEDGISDPTPFGLLLARYQLLNQPLAQTRVTLSRTDLIEFE